MDQKAEGEQLELIEISRSFPSSGMNTFTVKSTDLKGIQKRVGVEDNRGNRATIFLHRYAQVSKGDILFIDPAHSSRISVVSSDEGDDKIKVAPHYEETGNIKVGSKVFATKISELVTQDDIDGYNFLEAFHYRTSAPVAERESDAAEVSSEAIPQTSGGRKAVLLLSIRVGPSWQPIGYIELQMPLLMVKPRHDLFATAFSHPSRPIEWKVWDQHAIRQHVNRIVRIARVVTSPEYRGLGISKILVTAAKSFSISRWHIRGKRPVFLEISAEMLRHLDFVSSSGFVFAGNTEGNLSRIHKDLLSMRKNYAISSGIMTLQKKYLKHLEAGAEALNRPFESLLALVEQVSLDPSTIHSLHPSEYYYVKSVLRFPRPYYLCGLDSSTESYLRVARENLDIPESKGTAESSMVVKSGRLKYTSISISTNYRLQQSAHARAIMDCFGLAGDSLESKVIQGLSVEASGGNLIFISGPSGSGKSLLLGAFDESVRMQNVNVKREPAFQSKYSVGWMSEILAEEPLIEYFASRWGMERALAALNQAGLSEAFVYLKPFSLLSRGQKYRAKLAQLALGESQVWLIDEFCADLDPITARIVATNLKRHVVKYQRIAIVAAANHQHFLDALKPTQIIQLRQGFPAQKFSYREYLDEFHFEE